MGVAVSTRIFKRGHEDKKVGNHFSRDSNFRHSSRDSEAP